MDRCFTGGNPAGISLSSPRYQKNFNQLAHDLNIPKMKLSNILATLESLGIIEHKNGKYRSLIKNIHLPKESPIFSHWRNQLRIMSLERLNRGFDHNDYSFSVVFSSTPAVRTVIQSGFLQFLKDVESKVNSSEQEESYQMNFDLFSWIQT